MAKINNDNEYKAIMARIEELFFETEDSGSANNPKIIELDILSALVEEYEKEHFPIQRPSLQETILYKMNEMKCSQQELAVLLGITAPRLSDIINGKKSPTYQQARTISSKLEIDPAIVLSI